LTIFGKFCFYARNGHLNFKNVKGEHQKYKNTLQIKVSKLVKNVLTECQCQRRIKLTIFFFVMIQLAAFTD